MSWRYMAFRLNGDGTETPIHYDVPLTGVQITDELSKPGWLSGKISPEIASLKDDEGRVMFEPWSTVIYAEAEGRIRFGAILTLILEAGPDLVLDCVGFTGYADEMPFDDEWKEVKPDPLDVARRIWSHLQEQPGGDIGLRVDDTTSPATLGGDSTSYSYSSSYEYENADGVQTGTNSGGGTSDNPYRMAWYHNLDLGQEFSKLADETPFDYRVEHKWEGDRVDHFLRLGYPDLGRRLHDLRFVVGENVTVFPEIEHGGDGYASEVIVLGSGEGRKMIRGEQKRTTNRLRRVAVMADKGMTSESSANKAAAAEVKKLMGEAGASIITVREHPNAPLTSFQVGDETLLQFDDGWSPGLDMWCRIQSINFKPEQHTATLTVARVEKA